MYISGLSEALHHNGVCAECEILILRSMLKGLLLVVARKGLLPPPIPFAYTLRSHFPLQRSFIAFMIMLLGAFPCFFFIFFLSSTLCNTLKA